MGSFGLPALSIRPPEQPDLLGNIGKIAQLKGAMQSQQIGQEQLQSDQMKNQMQAQQLRDQQVVQQTLSATNGDLDAALPQLASKVSPQTFMGLDKFNRDRKKEALDTDSKVREQKAAQHNDLLGLIDQAQALPPDQYAQNAPGIVTKALQIMPELKGHIDPLKPPSQQDLSGYKLGIQTETQFLAKAKQADEANKQAETVRHNQAMEGQPTEPRLLERAAAGDPLAIKALKLQTQQKIASRPVINNMTGNDAKDIADAIENGDQPPTLTGLYRNAGPVRAELARRGFPLAQATSDWTATQKHLSTMNGAQQERLRQAVSFTSDSLPIVEDLYGQWKATGLPSGFKTYNKAALIAASHLPGKQGSIATNLISQIQDLTSELGTVYKGGNSSTDESLKLAAGNLSADWNDQTFSDGLKRIHQNLNIRKNSINHSMPAGVSANSPYTPQGEQSGASPAAPPTNNFFTQFQGKPR